VSKSPTNLYFTPEEAPVALEIRRADIEDDLAFAPPAEGKPFRQATLARPNIPFASVVAVHPLDLVQSNGVPAFKLAAPAKIVCRQPASSAPNRP
jgi:hypothetical protein